MTPKKQSTNAENSKRIDNVELVLGKHDDRISVLETAKIGTDAVADYLIQHPAQTVTESKLNKDLVKVVLTFLSVITALIYLAQGLIK